MKNVILLVTDTFRYDNLFDYADRPVRTPCLDAFINERATSIDNFFTASFPTVPHRTDLARGVLGWPHYGWQPIDVSGPNHIAKILGHQGYATQLICDCPHLFNNNFQQGFDAAFQLRGQEGDKHLLHLNDEIRQVLPLSKTRQTPNWRGRTIADQHRWVNRYFETEEEMFMARTAAVASRWLEENYRAEPFFLWVEFFDPHEPWDPPEYLVEKYHQKYEGVPMIHPNYGLASDYTEDELTNLWAHYAAESEMVDRHIGRVLQKIDDLDLWEDSIVIVTSDHGISIGEHNRAGKSNISESDDRFWPIYPEVGHIPFLLAGGDIPPGQRLDLIAQPQDILPTISALAGFETKVRQPLEGISFADAIITGQSEHRDLAVSGGFITPTATGDCPPKSTTPFIVDKKWGYAPVGANGDIELFDLHKDPRAEINIAAANKGVVTVMQERFIEYLKGHNTSDEVIACWTPRSG